MKVSQHVIYKLAEQTTAFVLLYSIIPFSKINCISGFAEMRMVHIKNDLNKQIWEIACFCSEPERAYPDFQSCILGDGFK